MQTPSTAGRPPSPTPASWTGRSRRRASAGATAPRRWWRHCRARATRVSQRRAAGGRGPTWAGPGLSRACHRIPSFATVGASFLRFLLMLQPAPAPRSNVFQHQAGVHAPGQVVHAYWLPRAGRREVVRRRRHPLVHLACSARPRLLLRGAAWLQPPAAPPPLVPLRKTDLPACTAAQDRRQVDTRAGVWRALPQPPAGHECVVAGASRAAAGPEAAGGTPRHGSSAHPAWAAKRPLACDHRAPP
jgi:hypothetical protein